MKIGQVIHKIRKEKKATLEQIALSAGTDSANLSRVERDLQQLTPNMLENVAKALDVPVSSLYLIAEQTISPYKVQARTAENEKAVKRLEDCVTRFALLSPDNQQFVNELIALVLKSQRK